MGPFRDSLDLLTTGVVENSGVREIILAGYPEGHPRIDTRTLAQALRAKMALARERGLDVSLITQFAFDPAPIRRWIGSLRAQGVLCPVRIGVAGPASIATLAKFAVRCGIGASLRALGRGHAAFARILVETGPDELIDALVAEEDPDAPIDGLHLFTFGGSSPHRRVDPRQNPIKPPSDAWPARNWRPSPRCGYNAADQREGLSDERTNRIADRHSQTGLGRRIPRLHHARQCRRPGRRHHHRRRLYRRSQQPGEGHLHPDHRPLIGGIDFTNIFVTLKGPHAATLADAQKAGAVTLNIGVFINTVIQFVIVAFAVFWLVKALSRLLPPPRPAAAPPRSEALLEEIRDILAARRA